MSFPVALVVGQKTTLTASLLDSGMSPVTSVSPSLIEWTVDDHTIATITASNQGTPSGSTIMITALTPGATNVTAQYNSIQFVASVSVAATAVASIAVSQGPVF